MSKFCGNCGLQLDDNAKVCGNCGTPLANNRGVLENSVPKIDFVDPEVKEKNKKKFTLIFIGIVLIVVALIAINIISGFFGFKGTVRKIMNAYENYDLDAITTMSSELYYYMDDESYENNYFANIIANDLENFETQVGHKYKLSYKITDSYEMSEHRYKDLLDTLSSYEEFDESIISKVMVAEIEVTAKGDGKKTKQLNLTLSKENGSWKLLYLN